ncbi:MAG: hypothetical protein HZB56_05370 [Deltaproteobacteria bacterium]|nr:hypothetical protein [Deltaproteobacteria bacterium]
MLSLAVILTLAATPGHLPLRVLERLPLPAQAGPVSVRVDPLESRVTLTAPQGAAALARALRSLSPASCRSVQVDGDEVVLGCRSQRLAARVVSTGGGQALELRILAGLPTEGPDGFPLVAWDPAALRLEACPGLSPFSRGECLLAQGDRAAARAAFRQVGGDGGHAQLRLGDLALAEGDTASAAAQWSRVTTEPWRRLAAARLCQIDECSAAEESDSLHDSAGLPAPLAVDLAVHGARAVAFRGNLAEAVRRFSAAPAACAATPLLCRRVLLAALRADPATAEVALAAYARVPDRDRGELALPLVQAAAGCAQEAGAPEYAANLLAAATPLVPRPELGAHLLRTIELYLAADDAVRGRVVLDYARVHLGKKLPGPRWAAATRALRPQALPRPAPPPAEPAAPAEIAAAAEALARARALAPPETR